MISAKKKLSLAARFLLIFLSAVMLSLPVFAASYPKPKNNVADEAGVLSESTIRAIQTANKTLEIDTGCTIAVCTVDTTGDTDIAEYARGVFKEWKLGEGVLLLIAKNDENYYFVQSVGVEKVLSNETLETIRDQYLEEDFAAGNIDRGVNKCVTKLKNELTAGINAPSEEETDEDKPEEKGTTAGSVIVGFFKAILYIILIAIVLFVAFFIYAMFNDDAAAILQKYIFRRGQPQKMPEEYYDERLYGRPGNSNGSQRRNPNQRNLPQGQRRQLPPPNQPQNRSRSSNGMNANQRRQNTGNYNYQNNQQRNTNRSQSRNQEQYRQEQYRQNPYSQNSRQSYNQPRNGQYNSQNYDAGSETRAYTIPGRNNKQQ